MWGKGTARGDTGMAALPGAAGGGGVASANCRACLSARFNAARLSALASGSSARSRVWPTTSTGLDAAFFLGFWLIDRTLRTRLGVRPPEAAPVPNDLQGQVQRLRE